MGQIFNLDNPVWNFMSKVADLVILNILVIICSLPIVTAGAAWTALYFVTIRMVKKEEAYVIKDFIRSFKGNFKQATIIWLMALVAIAVFTGDIIIYRMMPQQIPMALILVIVVLAYLVLGTIFYVFPLLSRFYNTIWGTIRNAFLVSIVNIPYTILFVILAVVPIMLWVFVAELTPFFLLFGFSAPAYVASIYWTKIFRKFEPEKENASIEPETIQEGTAE